MIEVTDIKGIGPAMSDKLSENGYESVEDIAQADPDEMSEINGVTTDRALEYMVGAGDLLDAEKEVEEESEEFDLTEELKEIKEIEEEVEADEDEERVDESDDESENDEYEVSISFEDRMEYDTFHAALMRHHESVYSSYQPASDAMRELLDGLKDFDSVTYELTEFELNTLHTAVKQQRTNYQGENKIDHMDALQKIEKQIDEARTSHLF